MFESVEAIDGARLQRMRDYKEWVTPFKWGFVPYKPGWLFWAFVGYLICVDVFWFVDKKYETGAAYVLFTVAYYFMYVHWTNRKEAENCTIASAQIHEAAQDIIRTQKRTIDSLNSTNEFLLRRLAEFGERQ